MSMGAICFNCILQIYHGINIIFYMYIYICIFQLKSLAELPEVNLFDDLHLGISLQFSL